MTEAIALPAFPAPLRWLNPAASWRIDGDDALTVTAGSGTDLFADPGTLDRFGNAPALVGLIEGEFTLSARMAFDSRAAFDAGVLLLYGGERTWAKFCLEVSPQGRLTVVSVVTRGVSDDCNSITVDGDAARLRVSRVGRAFAFHVAADDGNWQLIRYFALDGEPETGFLAQSPTGDGCSVRFTEIRHAPERLGDLRDGR
jgi:regulation of enolase protein 1 (concanavalin A-like superfamily)